jgi:iron-sulfur cluster repair protein YtfE (RIC family)
MSLIRSVSPAATAAAPAGIVELLLACHDRIRSFAELAVRLAEATRVPADELRDAAQRVRRYFVEALPLHVADEEQTVLPRLRGRDAAVDAALDAMHAEHLAHEPHLVALVATCHALALQPSRHDELRPTLETSAAALHRDFLTHLAGEEAIVFPAIERWIDAAERTAMLAELRARRG